VNPYAEVYRLPMRDGNAPRSIDPQASSRFIDYL
jgi:hypothetical protein